MATPITGVQNAQPLGALNLMGMNANSMNIPLIIANIAHALDITPTPQQYKDLETILENLCKNQVKE